MIYILGLLENKIFKDFPLFDKFVTVQYSISNGTFSKYLADIAILGFKSFFFTYKTMENKFFIQI